MQQGQTTNMHSWSQPYIK